MRTLFHSLFGFFLTWWGLFIFSAIDSSIFFFLPLGIDALVIYLSARHRDLFWLYPLMATAGSSAGAMVTYWMGLKAGEAGLPRLAGKRRIERVRARVKDAGAIAIALPAALPPPFPLTPFILTCGALAVSRTRLMLVFAGTRFLRFGAEALLARRYGARVLRVIESDTFQYVIVGFVVIAVAGTIVSGVVLWRRTRQPA